MKKFPYIQKIFYKKSFILLNVRSSLRNSEVPPHLGSPTIMSGKAVEPAPGASTDDVSVTNTNPKKRQNPDMNTQRGRAKKSSRVVKSPEKTPPNVPNDHYCPCAIESPGEFSVQCDNCDQPAHFVRECPYPPRPKGQGKGGPKADLVPCVRPMTRGIMKG